MDNSLQQQSQEATAGYILCSAEDTVKRYLDQHSKSQPTEAGFKLKLIGEQTEVTSEELKNALEIIKTFAPLATK